MQLSLFLTLNQYIGGPHLCGVYSGSLKRRWRSCLFFKAEQPINLIVYIVSHQITCTLPPLFSFLWGMSTELSVSHLYLLQAQSDTRTRIIYFCLATIEMSQFIILSVVYLNNSSKPFCLVSSNQMFIGI